MVLRERSYDYQFRYCGHCNTTTDIKEANFFGRSEGPERRRAQRGGQQEGGARRQMLLGKPQIPALPLPQGKCLPSRGFQFWHL